MKRSLFLVVLVLATVGVARAHGVPHNDDFAAAQIVTFPGSVFETLDTHGATNEAGESNPPYGPIYKSVWYRVSTTQAMTLRVSASAPDGVASAGAWRGDSLASLEWVTGGEPVFGRSSFSLPMQPGDSLRVQVGTENEEGGAISLQLTAVLDINDVAVDLLDVKRVEGSLGPLDERADITLGVVNQGKYTRVVTPELRYCEPGAPTARCSFMKQLGPTTLEPGARASYSYSWSDHRWIGDVDVLGTLGSLHADADGANDSKRASTWFAVEGLGTGFQRPLV